MKVKAKVFFFDNELKKHIEEEQIYEVSEDRAKDLMEKDLVSIIEEKKEMKKPRTKKAVKRGA